MIVCWSVKGGSGTTVVASTLALMRAAESQRGALLVDLAGDAPAVLGMAEPSGPGVSDWFSNRDYGSRMTLQSIAVQATANLQVIARGSKPASTSETSEINFIELCAALKTFDLPIIIDAGCGQPSPDLLAHANSSLLVTRPCYLSLRRAAQLSVSPTGIVLINEAGRALGKHDIEAVIGAPVVAEISFDSAIARAVDAGLLASRIPTIMSKQLATVA